ncbi:MAG TPA: hypothetical protein VHB46_18570 [Burkholderiales bacterium]|nr:hypothetical protein [Burkholderiales bacterium]
MRQESLHRDIDARRAILGVLERLARRMWIANAIREAAFAASVILFAFLCFELALPSMAFALRAAILLAGAGVIAGATGKISRKISSRAAAAEADQRAQLHDELKSALCFLEGGGPSEIEKMQLGRAAVTAARLDLRALMPRRIPAAAWAAAACGLLLTVVASSYPGLTRAREADAPRLPDARNGPADLRSLLEGAPDRAEIAKLDLALTELQRDGAPTADKARALADARDAIDQANMEASAARESVAALAQSLKADPNLERVAQAISGGHLAEASARLHDLQAHDEASSTGPDELPAEKPAALEEGERKPHDAEGRELPARHALVNQEALNRVINALEQAQEKIEVQVRVNNLKRHMDDNLRAVNQRSQLTASQFDNRTSEVNPTPSPETGNLEVRGGTLFRQGAVARQPDEEGGGGSQAGDASGDSAAQPLEGWPTARLGAKLKLETIEQKADPDDADARSDTGFFHSASRRQKSKRSDEDVSSNAGAYWRDAALDHERVPERQKAAVKRYFLNLHESESR